METKNAIKQRNQKTKYKTKIKKTNQTLDSNKKQKNGIKKNNQEMKSKNKSKKKRKKERKKQNSLLLGFVPGIIYYRSVMHRRR